MEQCFDVGQLKAGDILNSESKMCGVKLSKNYFYSKKDK